MAAYNKCTKMFVVVVDFDKRYKAADTFLVLDISTLNAKSRLQYIALNNENLLVKNVYTICAL